MTAKEKAEELFMIYVIEGMSQIKPVINRVIRKEMAKQCALIAVDELEKQEATLLNYNSESYSSEYWQEVKQEIKKI